MLATYEYERRGECCFLLLNGLLNIILRIGSRSKNKQARTKED